MVDGGRGEIAPAQERCLVLVHRDGEFRALSGPRNQLERETANSEKIRLGRVGWTGISHDDAPQYRRKQRSPSGKRSALDQVEVLWRPQRQSRFRWSRTTYVGIDRRCPELGEPRAHDYREMCNPIAAGGEIAVYRPRRSSGGQGVLSVFYDDLWSSPDTCCQSSTDIAAAASIPRGATSTSTRMLVAAVWAKVTVADGGGCGTTGCSTRPMAEAASPSSPSRAPARGAAETADDGPTGGAGASGSRIMATASSCCAVAVCVNEP